MVQRIAVLFSRLSGYMSACLKTLKDQHGVELLVFRYVPANEAPFDSGHFDWIDVLHSRSDFNREGIASEVFRFNPQAILMVGWMDDDYLHVARQCRQKGIPVIAGCDTPWKGSFRQHLAKVIAPWYLHSAIDILWVAGERQRQLARRLGYRGDKCLNGYYACEWSQFAHVKDKRGSGEMARAFFYVGRYIEVKAIDILIEAYQTYRTKVKDPWKLICAGAGPLASLMEGKEGVENRGFVQPDQLPALMGSASVFILPSYHEAWGVVVQEAAATGLPLICSDAIGASVHLLQDGYNGFLFETGNVDQLSQFMVRFTEMQDEEVRLMGERSYELSKQFTPERWAQTLLSGIAKKLKGQNVQEPVAF